MNTQKRRVLHNLQGRSCKLDQLALHAPVNQAAPHYLRAYL